MAPIKSLSKKKPRTVSLTSVLIAFIFVCFAMMGCALYFLNSHTAHLGETQNESFPSEHHQKQGESDATLKEYHMVFSTSCSPFQDWQSILFFYFAWKVKQPGTVTRIASGCNDAEAERLQQVHREQIEVLSLNFKLHITPDFNFSDDTKYFNKPFGIQH